MSVLIFIIFEGIFKSSPQAFKIGAKDACRSISKPNIIWESFRTGRPAKISAGRARALALALVASRPTHRFFPCLILSQLLHNPSFALLSPASRLFSPNTSRQWLPTTPGHPSPAGEVVGVESAGTACCNRPRGQPLTWGDGLAVRHHTPCPLAFALHAPTRPCYERRPVIGDSHHGGACCNIRQRELESQSQHAATRRQRVATGGLGLRAATDQLFCWNRRREVLQPAIRDDASGVR